MTLLSQSLRELDVEACLAGPLGLDLLAHPRHHATMLIYKIFRANEWQALQEQGETTGAPIDVTDGYIHFSTAETVRETAAKHFAGEDDLVVLACETGTLSADLKWEVSRGDALFPHLYRPLKLDDVIWEDELPLIDGVHDFPEDVE